MSEQEQDESTPPRQREGADDALERVRAGIAELYGVSAESVGVHWTGDYSATVDVRFPPDLQYVHLSVVPSGPAPVGDEMRSAL